MQASRRSNCIFFAVSKYLRYGGYLVFRGTKLNKYKWIVWFHLIWLPIECPNGGKCLHLDYESAWGKFRKNGGYLAVSKFGVAWLPPEYSGCKGFLSFVPNEEIIKAIPPFLFIGHEKIGDNNETN